MTMKRIARVFQEPTGLFHYCDERLPYLDARGMGFSTKRQAMEAAYMAGFTHACGSGTYRSGATICSQVPSARALQDDHEAAQADEAYYDVPARESR